jgi:hypothetical protein
MGGVAARAARGASTGNEVGHPRFRVDQALLRRFRTGMRSDPNTADRLVLVLLSLVGLRFANWLWLSARIPGKAGLVANVALQVLPCAVFVFLSAQSCRTTLPDHSAALAPSSPSEAPADPPPGGGPGPLPPGCP